MAENMDETKDIKVRLDDETVEQLVDDRFVRKAHTSSSKHSKNKKRKKKNYGLSAVITVLAFILVFVIFFLGSYIFFTAAPQTPEVNETNTQQIENDAKNDDAVDKTFTKEADEDEEDAVTKESQKDDADKKEEPLKENSEDTEDDKTPSVQKPQNSVSSKPAQSGTNAPNPQTPAKKEDTTQKSEPVSKPEPVKPSTTSPQVVEKNEDSEAIILD